MTLMQRVIKPKSQKAKRALEAREPKAVENTKETLFIRGQKCSDTIRRLMKDLAALKKPHAEALQRPNPIRPFEDPTPVERFARKMDKSLFVFGQTSKKRPDNLILGRCYDGAVLDMIELGVDKFRPLTDFGGEKPPTGTKPVLMFAGEAFETQPELQRLKSLLIDLFRGPEVQHVRLAGIEHALQFTATPEGRIYLRSYAVQMKRSATPKVPRIELEEIGPSVDWVLRRSQLASAELFKTACKRVKNVYGIKKIKNIEKDEFGSVFGTIHLPSQDLSRLQTRKMKGLKVAKAEKIQAKRDQAERARQARDSAAEEDEADGDEADGDEANVSESE
eukprot:snap_masked-scaffold5_size1054832-processed-gene-0.10 protein:Tk04016 transcript:snap_masked-scaffold5_size1054832-processed-gene-0.10-mRNA-1 annotation:"brix domain-containing protein 1"